MKQDKDGLGSRAANPGTKVNLVHGGWGERKSGTTPSPGAGVAHGVGISVGYSPHSYSSSPSRTLQISFPASDRDGQG